MMQKLFIGAITILISVSLMAKEPAIVIKSGDELAEKTEKTKTIKLPNNPKAIVISLNFKGGRRRVKKNDPTLSILADGTILIPDKYGHSKDVESKMSQAELQELLQFIVVENRFLKYDKKLVEDEKSKAIDLAPGDPNKRFARPRIMDASTTVITVHANGKKVEASEYALSIYQRGVYKDVLELQQLIAISKRLQSVINITKAGGQEHVNSILAMVNKELKQQHPKAKPLEFKHFQSSRTNTDGITKYSFYRSKPDPQGNPKAGTYTVATVETPRKGKPVITIHVKLK